MLKEIKNVVFDLGGVICDIEIERVVAAFREIQMPNMANLMDPCYPAEVNERMECGEISWEEACDEMRKIDNRPEVTNEQIEWVYREFLPRVNGAKLDTIDRLRSMGIRTYILSNTNPRAIEIVRDRVREATGRELDSYFDAIYLSFQLGILKPSPAIFERMIEQSGINPAETLFVDDGSRNADTAHARGFSIYCPPTNGEWMHIFEDLNN